MRSLFPRVVGGVLVGLSVACHKQTTTFAFTTASRRGCSSSINSRSQLLQQQPIRKGLTVMMASSSTNSVNDKNTIISTNEPIRVLALHGSGDNADEFSLQLEEAFREDFPNMDITAIQAPFPKNENGYCWWTMPPGIRSFTADQYEGFETSANKVMEVYDVDKNKKIDLVVAHSQGAILMASLITLHRLPYHPQYGYILNGCAFCNPFAAQVESLQIKSSSSKEQQQQERPPRCLFVIAHDDKVTPCSIQEKMRDGFQKAGLAVSTIQHPGGHSFPTEDDNSRKLIQEWILAGSNKHAGSTTNN
eukprot:scaffold2322_cov135-Cylindrotheca_fusiformis.AAC.24